MFEKKKSTKVARNEFSPLAPWPGEEGEGEEECPEDEEKELCLTVEKHAA